MAVKHFSPKKPSFPLKPRHFLTDFVKLWQSTKQEFVSGDWQRNTTKDTKSTKMELKGHCNHEIELHDRVSREDRLLTLAASVGKLLSSISFSVTFVLFVCFVVF